MTNLSSLKMQVYLNLGLVVLICFAPNPMRCEEAREKRDILVFDTTSVSIDAEYYKGAVPQVPLRVDGTYTDPKLLKSIAEVLRQLRREPRDLTPGATISSDYFIAMRFYEGDALACEVCFLGSNFCRVEVFRQTQGLAPGKYRFRFERSEKLKLIDLLNPLATIRAPESP